MSVTWTCCDVETVTPRARLWGRSGDCSEKTERPECRASEGDRECEAEALVRVWSNNKAESEVSLCFSHALEQDEIFFVEPVCRQDFYSSEYEFLLERSTIGHRIAKNLGAPLVRTA